MGQRHILGTSLFLAGFCIVGVPAGAQTSDDLDALLGDAGDAPPSAQPDDRTRPAAADTSESGTAAAPEATPEPYAQVIAVQSDDAQTPAGDPAPRRASRAIEEIVVTAQRREENLQDVPISVAAFSGEKLDALGIETAQDLQLVVPGMNYSVGPIGYNLIYIRGIGTDVFIPSADSSVATYVDGVYFPYAHGLASSFAEVERIEVLKGPQGTLFGRNTTGGAINIITRSPAETFEGKLKVELGTYNKRSARGYVSVPVTEDLAISLAAFQLNANSYYSAAPESPVQVQPELEDRGAHVRLRFDITETLALDLAGLFTRATHPLLNSIEDTKPVGALFRPRDTRPYEYDSNVDGFLRTRDDLYSAQLSWATDRLNAKLFASTQAFDGQTLYDFDGGPVNGVYFDVPDEFVDATSAEAQLQSTPGGLLTFDDTVEWTLGYYFFDSLGGYGSVNFGVLEPSQSGPGSLFGLDRLLQLIGDLDLPIPDNVEIQERGTVETRSHALYGQTTWRPRDWIGLTLGGRFQRETRGTVTSGSSLSLRPLEATIPLFDFDLQSRTTTNFSPKVALDIRPFADETMVYASWQKGFKSGTFNVVSLNQPPAYVEPEEVTAIELGLKGTLLDQSLTYNVAVFRNQIKNLQTLNISLTSGGTSQLSNAAQATIQGFDFDVTWQVFPQALPGFVLTAAGAYLDGEYDDFPNGAGFDETTGLYFGPGQLVPSPRRDFSGNETSRTPEFSGTFGINQTFEVPGGDLELGGNLSYNSGFFYDTQNTVSQPSYTLVNARISYYYRAQRLRLTVFGANLTDEFYYGDKVIADFGVNAYLAAPRTYGASLNWEFGGG